MERIVGNLSQIHLHSSFSILDSVSKIEDIVKRIKEHGNTHVALTDHGTISAMPAMAYECKKAGIQHIPACEFYMTPDVEQKTEEGVEGGRGKRTAHHLILLAMNENGWRNIKLLNTQANRQFYYVPRIDYKDLEKYGSDIICLTACLKGIVPHYLAIDDFDKAAFHARKLKSIFEDRFYLEVQDGGLDVQPKINRAMRALGEHLDIPIVGCQDAHYVDRNDVEAHEALWAIRTQDTFDQPVGYGKGKEFRPYYRTREYWLKSFEEILGEDLTTEDGNRRRTDLLQSELEMSQIIAERCKPIPIESKMHLPRYEFVPEVAAGCATKCHADTDIHGHTEDLTSFNYLFQLVSDGYEKRFNQPYFDAPDEYRLRVEKEMGDIKLAKLADYFLIIWDICSWAMSEKIPVGPARGSAAGSLVSYCLYITHIDPIPYGLIWERFYNAGRVGSLADIDLDFSKRRRDEVINYIKNRFGENRVAQMVTFNTLGTKAALKDTAKVLGSQGMSFDDANLMTRYVPDKPEDIADAVERSDKLKEYKENNPRLFSIAEKLEGCPKSSGKHAAGILISDEDFSTGNIPLRWDTKGKHLITEWDGDTLDKLGLMKVDILGISTLDVLADVAKEVNKGLKSK
jgi:DNA polymerase-3 subunit alpha